MTMRVELTFARPLTREDRTRILLTLGAVAGAKRVTFGRTGYGATIHGEGLGVHQVETVLREAAIRVESLHSSLAEADGPPAGAVESFKPLGRQGGPGFATP